MKKLLLLTLLITGFNAKATMNQAVLTAYDQGADYPSCSYNFEKMTQDRDLTGNRYHIIYHPSNRISTGSVMGDLGVIADVAATSCKEVGSEMAEKFKGSSGYPTPEDRLKNPLSWLNYTDAWYKLTSNPAGQVTPTIGHCYLMQVTGYDGITTAMFHVKDVVPGKMLVIDEMELFQHAKFAENKK